MSCTHAASLQGCWNSEMITDIEVKSENASRCNPDTWVDQYGDYLFRYALLRLRDRDRAEEAVQETFLAAFKGKNHFSGNSSERTWLVGILKHKIIDHFRRVSKEVPFEETSATTHELDEPLRTAGEWVGHWKEEAGPVSWGADPVKLLQQKEFYKALERCLNALSPRLAQVFILREMEELSTAEICRILNITESNLWVMLHRARMQLRKSLELEYIQPKMKNRL